MCHKYRKKKTKKKVAVLIWFYIPVEEKDNNKKIKRYVISRNDICYKEK